MELNTEMNPIDAIALWITVIPMTLLLGWSAWFASLSGATDISIWEYCSFAKHDFVHSWAGAVVLMVGVAAGSILVMWLYFTRRSRGTAITYGCVMIVASAMAWYGAIGRHYHPRGLRIATQMHALWSAEQHWYQYDIDRNGLKDYWTRDIAGLYALPDSSGNPVFVITKSLAAADSSPFFGRYSAIMYSRSHLGYQVQAMEQTASGTPYQLDADGDGYASTNLAAFGFTAFPEDYPDVGRFTFIVNHSGEIWARDLAGKACLQWPKDPDADGWIRFDEEWPDFSLLWWMNGY